MQPALIGTEEEILLHWNLGQQKKDSQRVVEAHLWEEANVYDDDMNVKMTQWQPRLAYRPAAQRTQLTAGEAVCDSRHFVVPRRRFRLCHEYNSCGRLFLVLKHSLGNFSPRLELKKLGWTARVSGLATNSSNQG